MSSEDVEQAPEQVSATQSELESLQAEVTELRRQVAEADAAKAERGHGWRRFVVILLIVLASIVAMGATVTLWARAVVLNTDAWVRTVGPLSQNEVIVSTISSYVVGEVFETIDAEQVAQGLLPPDLAFLSTPLVSALQDVVRDVVAELIVSDQFNAVWVGVNRTAHQVIIGALRFDEGPLSLKGGRLVLDLSGPFAFVEDTLGLDALDLFADKEWGEFVLFESQQVAILQQALAMLDAVGLILPFLALALYFVAWLISLWRRRTVLWIGVALAVAMVLLLVLLFLAQPILLAAVADPLMRAVTGEIWNVVTRGLFYRTIFVLVVGVIIAVAAALAGPHPQAVAFRAWVRERTGRQTSAA
jgi:hypothetical protein